MKVMSEMQSLLIDLAIAVQLHPVMNPNMVVAIAANRMLHTYNIQGRANRLTIEALVTSSKSFAGVNAGLRQLGIQ